MVLILFANVFETICAQATETTKQQSTTETTITLDCPGRFTDLRNNQTYSATKIGNQCWMAENLNIGKSVKTPVSNHGQIKKYCFEYNPDNCELYGGLYTWDEMMAWSADKKGICPGGWHVPDDDEWTQLELSLGLAIDSLDQPFWRGHAVGRMLFAGNSSGFEATFAGYRSDEGLFLSISELAIFWTSSQKSPGLAWYRKVDPENTGLYCYYFSTSNACSLRCVKD